MAAEQDSPLPWPNRYGTLTAGDDELIIYDRKHPDAWVCSDDFEDCSMIR